MSLKNDTCKCFIWWTVSRTTSSVSTFLNWYNSHTFNGFLIWPCCGYIYCRQSNWNDPLVSPVCSSLSLSLSTAVSQKTFWFGGVSFCWFKRFLLNKVQPLCPHTKALIAQLIFCQTHSAPDEGCTPLWAENTCCWIQFSVGSRVVFMEKWHNVSVTRHHRF